MTKKSVNTSSQMTNTTSPNNKYKFVINRIQRAKGYKVTNSTCQNNKFKNAINR